MKAVLLEDCKIAPNGYTVISLFKGQIVSGEIADFCVEFGHAEIVKEPTQPAPAPAPQNIKPAKAPKKRG